MVRESVEPGKTRKDHEGRLRCLHVAVRNLAVAFEGLTNLAALTAAQATSSVEASDLCPDASVSTRFRPARFAA